LHTFPSRVGVACKNYCRIFNTTWWNTCCTDPIQWDKGRKKKKKSIADISLTLYPRGISRGISDTSEKPTFYLNKLAIGNICVPGIFQDTEEEVKKGRVAIFWSVPDTTRDNIQLCIFFSRRFLIQLSRLINYYIEDTYIHTTHALSPKERISDIAPRRPCFPTIT
jgi:hypothetical protein